MNQTVEQILRNYVNYYHNNWDEQLPYVQFAMNNHENASTKKSPAELVFGQIPKLAVDLIKSDDHVPSVDAFLNDLRNSISKAQENITQAQAAQKRNFDNHRRDHKFKIGDMVLLSNRNFRTDNAYRKGARKLRAKFEGPFPITEKIGKDTFRLELPFNWKIHNVFHASLLKPYLPNNDELFPRRNQIPPEPEIINDEEEFEVEEILDVRTRHKKKEYLVKWKNYPQYESTWEPQRNMRHAQQTIRDFERLRRSNGKITHSEGEKMALNSIYSKENIRQSLETKSIKDSAVKERFFRKFNHSNSPHPK